MYSGLRKRWMMPTAARAAAASLRVMGEVMSSGFPAAVQARVRKTPRFGKPSERSGIGPAERPVLSGAMARLLVVEDDAAISEPLVRALAREGHDVDHVDTGGAALERIAGGALDLVVLDVGLPDVDGVQVCRRARAEQPRLAILILTARSSELDEVLG